MTRGLTIGQVAAFAGVTVKTVRHYHHLGLVDEPRRDDSRYRRYGAAELLPLVQVRALAEAGVPLAEIGGLLAADPERFAAKVADVKGRLSERIDVLRARRDALDRIGGNRLLLPERACALLERATALGFSAEYLETSREALVLAKVVMPDFDAFLDQVELTLDDAKQVTLLKACWDARTWDPADPRVVELANAMTEHLIQNPTQLAIPFSLRASSDAASRHGLIDDFRAEVAPAWRRLSSLIESNLRKAGLAK